MSLWEQLHATAKALDTHEESMNRLSREWALGASSGATGPGQKGSHSDPTLSAVVGIMSGAQADILATYPERLDEVRRELRSIRLDVAPRSANWQFSIRTELRFVAGGLSRVEKAVQLGHLWRLLAEINDLIDATTPLTIEQANNLIDAKVALARPVTACGACDSPTDELRRGLCDGCRKRVTTWEQYNPGHTVDDSFNLFREWIIDDIVRGAIVRRASPFSPAHAVT